MQELFLDKLNEILANEVADKHSNFQIIHFIINKEPTIQGKLWQITRELKARTENLENLTLQIEELQDNLMEGELLLSKHDKLMSEEPDATNIKLIEISKRKTERRLKATAKEIDNLNRKMHYIREEMNVFISVYDAISNKEKIKPLDDIEAQTNYWSRKLSEEINLRNLLGMPLDLELVKTTLALPDTNDLKKNIVTMLQRNQNKLLEQLEKNG